MRSIKNTLIRSAAIAALIGGSTFATVAPSQAMIPPPDGGGTQSCVNDYGNPKTCAQAVTWAKNHLTTTSHSEYVNACDHIAGLEYGWAHSGSTTAYVHWTQIPTNHKYPGDRSVPAGGLAFFRGGSSGAGHVMISIGGGDFISNDINGSGTLTKTTIAQVENKWGETYLGWGQPWFKINH